jgi:uncharacterized tellurite resistance protein B-like protein
MSLTGFTDQQKQSLVDLLVLGMYADGNLDLIEDEKARQVLDSIQFSSDSARQYFIDASFARARKHSASAITTRSYVSEIAKSFLTPAMRRQVYDALKDSLLSDHQLAEKESELLVVVSEELKL